MKHDKTGGTAFPTKPYGEDTAGNPLNYEGMTLREYYAGQALSGLIVGYTHAYGSPTSAPNEVCAEAVSYADVLIWTLAQEQA